MKKLVLFFIVLYSTLKAQTSAPVCFNASGSNNSPSVGVNPTAITSDDFNGDGVIDLAVANFSSNNVSVLIGIGAGLFNNSINYSVGTNPYGIVSEDFNNDGKRDLAITNSGSNDVSILLGSGAGLFASAISYSVEGPANLISEDFNGDGNLDLAIAGDVSNNLAILLGTGTGSFVNVVYYYFGMCHPKDLTCYDFNGDGYKDILIPDDCGYLSKVSIFLGSSSGTFSASNSFTIGSSGKSICNSDFNKDGNVDLAMVDYNFSSASILLGVGSGGFSSPTYWTVGENPVSIISDDFDGDGNTDFAVANSSSDNISVTYGLGNGNFRFKEFYGLTAVNYGVGETPKSLIFEDINGDGAKDFVTTNFNSNNVSFIFGDISDTNNFISAKNYFLGLNTGPVTPIACDFNGDGKLDLAVPQTNSNKVSIFLHTYSSDSYSYYGQYTIHINPASITCGDFNSDGNMDIASVNSFYDISIIFGLGNGSFTSPSIITLTKIANFITSGDFNNDGKMDVVTANGYLSADITIHMGSGSGTFSSSTSYSTDTSGSIDIKVSDFNFDGKLDLVTINPIKNTMSVLIGNGDGSFVSATNYTIGTFPTSLSISDFNNDGKLDIAISHNSPNYATTFFGTGTGTFSSEINSDIGYATSIVSADLNNDGYADLASSTNTALSIYLGTGTGTFSSVPDVKYWFGAGMLICNDLDNDGDKDLVSSNYLYNYVSVLSNCNITTDVSIYNNSNYKKGNFNFNVYPNPTSGVLNIEFDSSVGSGKGFISGVQILNILGQVVYQSVIANEQSSINIQFIPNGVYFLKFFDKSQLIGTTKVIKE